MPTRTKTDARDDLRLALGELFAAQRRLRGRDAQNKDSISYAQMHLLRVLEEAGGELPASRLAACADLTPTTVTQMVDGLAKHGLVERVRSDEDRRVVFIRPTEAGREAYARQRATYEARSQELLADMTAQDLDQAAEVLRRVARMIDGL
jgi:MarR family transcriptional regulator, organic hydroperoxide resistance regulator